MSKATYDVVILGGGNAGMGVTVATREAGRSVAMIEPRELGGTCPNRGCTPKKVLVAAAHALHEIGRAHVHKIAVDPPKLDWAGLIERKAEMIAGIPVALATAMEKRGVDVIRGTGAFAGPNNIAVNGEIIEAEHIVVATGSKPRLLPIPGFERMINSDDVLNETSLPEEVVFVGGGVIAMEFAHVYARAGSRVTILEALPQILSNFDGDAVAQVKSMSEALGIDVLCSAIVKDISPRGERFDIVFDHEGLEHVVTADRVVNGAGRVADLDHLDLSKGGVSHKSGRIAVDRFLRSVSNPAVFVCGDALAGSPQLSPVATYEGRTVGRNIVEGPLYAPDYSAIPSCVYTVPAMANVGLREEAVRDAGLDYEAHVSNMSRWLSARTYAEETAWSKILVDRATDRILGAHMVGHAGEELIHIFALAMAHGITAGELKDTVYGFPTFSADIKSML